MNQYNILTPGEKIKSIRNKFDINQEEITGGEITRNLISIIENNKANLTEPVATILATSINNVCKKRQINFSVSKDYLLEDVISQAKKVADNYIYYIDNLNTIEITTANSKLNEIDLFLKKYNVEEKKSMLYIKIASKFKSTKNYQRAFDYYLKAFEVSIDNKVTLYSLEMMASCNVYLSKYTEALNYYNILLDLANDTTLKYHTKFNIALCYKKLSMFEEALETLNSVVSDYNDILVNSHKQYVEVYLLIGICLYELKSFNKAIDNYKLLLKTISSEDIKEEVLILINLADVYRTLKDTTKLEKTCNKILNKIANNADFMNVYEGGLYLSLSRNLRAINNNETANTLLLKAFECFKNRTTSICLEDVEKMLMELLQIFIQSNDYERIEYLKNEFFELIEKGLFPRGSIAALKFIRYYSSNKNLDEINNIVDFLAG